MTLTPYGPRSWLVSDEGSGWLRAAADHCGKNPLPGFGEWVLAHESLLLIFGHPVPEQDVRALLESTPPPEKQAPGTLHEIPVRYDGPDLGEVAELAKVGTGEVVQLHSAPTYTVRFLGFAPGFAYLDGLDPKLAFPRRETPRTRMDPGAVAIGGPHAGVYTVPSPGGWNWLGNTAVPLFDPHKGTILFNPGDTVRFVPQP